jgi:branched-chain amino acid transport system permease protein
VSLTLLAVQTLNGLQLGLLLFLIAAGLTLVFGVMDVINLAHGAQYMAGAYLAVAAYGATGHFGASLLLALLGALALGLVLEAVVLRPLYARSHLDQVLATFGVILILTEGARALFGSSPLSLPVPAALDWSVPLIDGFNYPVYRLAIIAAGLASALALWLLVTRTRLGMQVRAGAQDAAMLGALGVDVDRLFRGVAGFGAMLAGFAGVMAAPVLAVEPTMGDGVLILAFVVIVIGGVGSIRGAFLAALIVGMVDTLGRSFSTDLMRLALPPSAAADVGPALAAMAVYLLMAGVLAFRPQGLFPARAG